MVLKLYLFKWRLIRILDYKLFEHFNFLNDYNINVDIIYHMKYFLVYYSVNLVFINLKTLK